MYVWVMERENGYYWIQILYREIKKEYTIWLVAKWEDNKWFTAGSELEVGFYDNDDNLEREEIKSINETRLMPPEQ